MHVKNLDELTYTVKQRLHDYLTMQGHSVPTNGRPFLCISPEHDDNKPSMYYLDKGATPVVHCQACKVTMSTYDAYAALEDKMVEGHGFRDATIELAKRFALDIQIGNETAADRDKRMRSQLIGEIADLLNPDGPGVQEYMDSRNWLDDEGKCRFTYGSLDPERARNELMRRGWDSDILHASARAGGLLPTGKFQYFSKDAVTFVLRDYTGKPIGFATRLFKPDEEGRRWINTGNIPGVFNKKATLYGIDVALKQARMSGLFVVEGLGEVLQMHRLGILNAAACGSSNLTVEQLNTAKRLGIKRICLALDWDKAGQEGTAASINKAAASNIEMNVLGSNDIIKEHEIKDLDEYLIDAGDDTGFYELPIISAFEWKLTQMDEAVTKQEIIDQMLHVVAAEPMATRREEMVSMLSKRTGISEFAIMQDVMAIINAVEDEKNGRFVASMKEYHSSMLQDPSNARAHLMRHSSQLEQIEKDFKQSSIGSDYQLAKLERIQELNAKLMEQGTTGFIMKRYPEYVSMVGGGNSCEGRLIGIGGQAHNGKSVVMHHIATDILVNDPDANVVMHLTDDTVGQVMPSLMANIAAATHPWGAPWLSLREYEFPTTIRDPRKREEYRRVDSLLKKFLRNDKLILVDAEEGKQIQVFIEQIEYMKKRHPSMKLLAVQDNSYNSAQKQPYEAKRDKIVAHFDQLQDIAIKYRCAALVTMEYRKFETTDEMGNIVWPTNDHFKDAVEVQYRPHVLLHVVNDLVARAGKSPGPRLFWKDEMGGPQPIISVRCGKNKICAQYPNLDLHLDRRTKVSVAKAQFDEYLETINSERAAGDQGGYSDDDYGQPAVSVQ